jgi:galactokinase/mevalonate kinase-like predicted kinase
MPAQRFDQRLCDFQTPLYSQVLQEAGNKAVAMVASGDVWLDFDPLAIPEVSSDIVGIGMRLGPEEARHFGVFFIQGKTGEAQTRECPISLFLQKPTPAKIRELATAHEFFVDTGMWLLSERAVIHLFEMCGWDGEGFATDDGLPACLDLYTDIGNRLGTPAFPLRTGFIALENASFYHVGSNRSLFRSIYDIQTRLLSSRRRFVIATESDVCQIDSERPVWVEGSLPALPLSPLGANIITGLPPESRIAHLPENICVDVVPVDVESYCLRVYHLDDVGRGAPGSICGMDADAWLAKRGLMPSKGTDVFDLAVYPLLPAKGIVQDWIEWFVSDNPPTLRADAFLSAAEIPQRIDLDRYFAQRRQGYVRALGEQGCVRWPGEDQGLSHDFKAIAVFARHESVPPAKWTGADPDGTRREFFRVTDLARFESFAKEMNGNGDPFGVLREAILESEKKRPVSPRMALKKDQIVWARAPLRMDLAGGWTDTPPYCFEWGGCVLNVAVTLNGQNPVQVFVRPTDEPAFTIRSIDLGSSEKIERWGDIASFALPGASFSLAKAALAMAGFHPDFNLNGRFDGLRETIEAAGGGMELTLLCAVPKGSGLGTSSVLAATLLAALSKACGLGWNVFDICRRAIAMEQMLTTGGGWQDQAGALFPGIKLVETTPGLSQTPSVRYLPDRIISGPPANATWLLYYTGITRLAKSILGEIVADMFLGCRETSVILERIRANARNLHDAFERGDIDSIQRGIRRSWKLNKLLDSGTSSPRIEAILDACASDLAAAKLLGAGGGGYMLLCARDESAAARIRRRLENNPPNELARFVDFTVADKGIEVTVS